MVAKLAWLGSLMSFACAPVPSNRTSSGQTLVVDLQGRVALIDEALAAELGALADLCDRPLVFELLCEDDWGAIREWLTDPDAASARDLRFIGRNGGAVSRVASPTALRDGAGTPIGLAIRITDSMRRDIASSLDAEETRVEGTVQDITDITRPVRKQEQLQETILRAAFEWRMTFDSIPALILMVDERKRVCRLNTAALALSECTHYRDALGQRVEDLGTAAIWSELSRAVGAALSGERVASEIRDASGLHWNVIAHAWSLHGTARCTVFARDVTIITSMQESLKRNERMSAVGSLVAGVAHEVRNPLFAISATVDAIEATPDRVPSRFLPALRAQVNRMSELMQDLLEYGRPASAFESTDLASVLAAARTGVLPLLERLGLSVGLKTPSDLPLVWMDRRRLTQAFENLLRNAAQHSPAGGSIDVEALRTENSITVTVRDHGPGISAEDLTRMFEPFFTRRRGGTGLGLALVERIIEDHRGTITAANGPEGGAVMTVRVPFDEPEETS